MEHLWLEFKFYPVWATLKCKIKVEKYFLLTAIQLKLKEVI
jgi:hypothetical protein